MPENSDDKKIIQKLEDMEAKISQLEDRVLTNELDFQELRNEVQGRENASTPEALRSRLEDLENQLQKDLEDVEKWKNSFKNVTNKLEELEKENQKIKERLEKTGKEKDSRAIEIAEEASGRIEDLEKKISSIRGLDVAEDLSTAREKVNKFSEKIENLENRIDRTKGKTGDVVTEEDVKRLIENSSVKEEISSIKKRQNDIETNVTEGLERLQERIRDVESSEPSQREVSLPEEKLEQILEESSLKDKQEELEDKIGQLNKDMSLIEVTQEEMRDEKSRSRTDELVEKDKSSEELKKLKKKIEQLENKIKSLERTKPIVME